MKITWYGMACFMLESSGGAKVLTDPYDASVGYRVPFETADIVTVSHSHFDHSAVETVKGQPVIVNQEGHCRHKGINFSGIKTYHDNSAGKEMGENTAFIIEMDNIRFVHLGDIGHTLSPALIKTFKPCDILALPVGGIFTVEAAGAAEIVRQLNPSIVIPMHYSTPSCKLDLKSESEFTRLFPEIRRLKEWQGCRADMPGQQQVFVMMAKGD